MKSTSNGLPTRKPLRRLARSILLTGGVLLCALAGVPATAQAYTVHGAASCRDWASDDYDKGWALGYLSGFNAATASDLGSEIDNDELVRRVAALCRCSHGPQTAMPIPESASRIPSGRPRTPFWVSSDRLASLALHAKRPRPSSGL